jgi:hypothetical protein
MGNSSELRGTAPTLIDDPDFLRALVERAVQAILEAEMTAHLGAAKHERTEGRTGYRNGTKPRTLVTRVGTLRLAVPQDRDGAFSTELFARYQRSEQALVATLMEMYVQGVSTRKVAAITEELCGTGFSKSQVSALAGRLDADLTAWRTRSLAEHAYPYLSVDARYEHVRVDGRVVSQGVLLVAGVRADGVREVLAVDVADTESEASYQALFRSLKERGLRGVELVTSDRPPGVAGGDRAPLPGRRLAALPGARRAQPARPRRPNAAPGARRRPARRLRGGDADPGRGGGPGGGGALAPDPPGGGGPARGGAGGRPDLPRLPARAPGPDPDDERAGTLEPGVEAADPRGAHLPQPRKPAAAGHRAGAGAERGVGERAALPGHDAAGVGRGPSHAPARRRGGLTTNHNHNTEEFTETQGLDLDEITKEVF